MLNESKAITLCNKFIYKMRGRISRSFYNFLVYPSGPSSLIPQSEVNISAHLRE